MKYYTMMRTGTIVPSQHTDNQCKQNPTHIYDYECKILFGSSQKLDEQDFLIEHEEINKVIQSLGLKGSCERMASDIIEAVKKEFSERSISIAGLKITILPYPRGQANLSLIWLLSKDMAPLLNS